MRFQATIVTVIFAIFLISCAEEVLSKSSSAPADNEQGVESEVADSGDPPEENIEEVPLEIVAGVGIGPAKLGDAYGQLVDELGPPDSSFEYYRIVFAVWLEQGIEIVFSVSEDGEISESSPIISVGTKLMDGFVGEVTPGMLRSDVEALIGACTDVVDDVHCYHPAGLYLGFGLDDVIRTVAIHPSYTVRSGPPEMEMSVGGGS